MIIWLSRTWVIIVLHCAYVYMSVLGYHSSFLCWSDKLFTVYLRDFHMHVLAIASTQHKVLLHTYSRASGALGKYGKMCLSNIVIPPSHSKQHNHSDKNLEPCVASHYYFIHHFFSFAQESFCCNLWWASDWSIFHLKGNNFHAQEVWLIIPQLKGYKFSFIFQLKGYKFGALQAMPLRQRWFVWWH